ncbi:MAG: sugar transferase [Pirellulales bacterium]
MWLLDKPEKLATRHKAAAAWDGASAGNAPPGGTRWCNWLGRAMALVLLIPGLPMMLLTVFIVRLTSPGPGIYRQMRVGLGGRHFVMYKIRTMGQDAEARTGPVWATLHDPRVTKVGRIVRRLHLDELPQLFNVIRGDMALVGPRPERPEFTQRLGREIPGYLGRLALRPGITGLAQINLPADTDLDSVRRKLVLDLEYIAQSGPWLDARILLCTSLRMFGLNGKAARGLMQLRREPRIGEPDAPAIIETPAPVAAPQVDNASHVNAGFSASPTPA